MTTEKGKEIKEPQAETEFGAKILPEPQTEEPKPPTAEEQMATLQQQLDELKTKYEQADKGLRSAQATLTQKDRLLKEKENVRDEIETLKNMVKIIATQSVRGSDEDTDGLEATAKKKSPDIDKAFEELEQKQKTREYQNKLQEQIDSIRQRVESLGLTEDDESYWEIYKLATNSTPADFRLADIRLKKLEKEKTPVDIKPTDAKKQLDEALKEIARLKKAVNPNYDVEKGLPSGAAANEAQIRKAFRENPRNPKVRADYLELQRNKTE